MEWSATEVWGGVGLVPMRGGRLRGGGKPTQHIVNGTLLAEPFQTVQHAPHPFPEGT